jgi:hypothetical protein
MVIAMCEEFDLQSSVHYHESCAQFAELSQILQESPDPSK